MSQLRIAVAILITLVWAVVYLASVFSYGRINAPPEISAVMLAVVTWLFGTELRRSLRGGARKVESAAKKVEGMTDDRP